MSEINEMFKNVSDVVGEHMRKSRACKIFVIAGALVIVGSVMYDLGYAKCKMHFKKGKTKNVRDK